MVIRYFNAFAGYTGRETVSKAEGVRRLPAFLARCKPVGSELSRELPYR
jgi:hypothetical protein